MDAAFKNWLCEQFGDQVRLDEPMARHTSLGVGGPADVFIKVNDADQLRELVRRCTKEKVPYLALAGGTNLLVKDGGIRGVVIDMKSGLKNISQAAGTDGEALVLAQTGVGLQALCRYAIDNGLAGLNFALGIPGTVGGAVVMNAGTAGGAMGDVVAAVEVLTPAGDVVRKEKQALGFVYRGSCFNRNGRPTVGGDLILTVLLMLTPANPDVLRAEANDILKQRMGSQPKGVRSAGCFFKNPQGGEPAGKLIDQAGLKGRVIGGAAVSDIHANFIVAQQGAKAADVIELMKLIQQTVANDAGVRLEPEVMIVGE